MGDLNLNSLIKERIDLQCLSYILEKDNLFFSTGYKVLQNQEKNGFIKCNKVLHNGKIKLVYDVSKYKSLEAILQTITGDIFINILRNFISVIDHAKNNGFMQCENIKISFDKIFVDINNYNVYLIYLPINSNTNPEELINFEGRIKHNIKEAIEKYENIASREVLKICADIQGEYLSLDAIKNNLQNNSYGDINYNSNNITSNNLRNSSSLNSNKSVRNINNTRNNIYSDEPIEDALVDDSKKKGIFSKLFGKKSNKVVQGEKVAFKQISEGGNTELLDDSFKPTLLFCGLKTPVKVEFAIDKEEFLIGKNVQAVDGPITFNKAISRVHCKIKYINNKPYIIDMGSSNFTYVNGNKIQVNQQVPIKVGDRITLANSDFILKAI